MHFPPLPLIFLLLIFQPLFPVEAQEKFELKDGDRVVLLGAGLIENEQKYGWLEYVLTTAWPDRFISFRNLGWTGDTVFGEARTYFTTPPTPFELLIQQMKSSEPSIVFLAYGQVESEKGIQGIEAFTSGLNTLLDSLEKMGSKVVLVNPVMISKNSAPEEGTLETKTYRSHIEEIAAERKLLHLDAGSFLASLGEEYWETDVLLHHRGYSQLAAYIRKELGIPLPLNEIHVDWRKQQVQTGHPVSDLSWDSRSSQMSFSLTPKHIFLPVGDMGAYSPLVSITGLKKGTFGLKIDGEIVAIGTQNEWEKGVVVRQGPWIQQSERLRHYIQKKDEAYFRKYRPQNRTYILGFRAYEQGRHEEDLKDLGLLVAWLDGQIHQQKQPKTHQLELFPIQ
jgi:hypothetical protein